MVAGGTAPAATRVCDWQGQPPSCDPAGNACDVVGAGPVPGWTADEDLRPGGSLANVRISVLLHQDGTCSTDLLHGGVIRTVTGTGLLAALQVTGEGLAALAPPGRRRRA